MARVCYSCVNFLHEQLQQATCQGHSSWRVGIIHIIRYLSIGGLVRALVGALPRCPGPRTGALGCTPAYRPAAGSDHRLFPIFQFHSAPHTRFSNE